MPGLFINNQAVQTVWFGGGAGNDDDPKGKHVLRLPVSPPKLSEPAHREPGLFPSTPRALRKTEKLLNRVILRLLHVGQLQSRRVRQPVGSPLSCSVEENNRVQMHPHSGDHPKETLGRRRMLAASAQAERQVGIIRRQAGPMQAAASAQRQQVVSPLHAAGVRPVHWLFRVGGRPEGRQKEAEEGQFCVWGLGREEEPESSSCAGSNPMWPQSGHLQAAQILCLLFCRHRSEQPHWVARAYRSVRG